MSASMLLSQFRPVTFLLALLGYLALALLLFLLLRRMGRKSGWAKLKAPVGLFLLALVFHFFLRHSSLVVGPTLALVSRILILMAGAYLLVRVLEMMAIDLFLARWKGVKPPAILANLFSLFLFLLFLVLILHYILQVNLTPILATSAILSIVIGLALQEPLGNLFSGLTLHLEKSFEVGDWVSAGTHLGRVAEMNWRSIKLLTQDGSYVIIPNGTMAKEVVINHSQPESLQSQVLRIGLPYESPPSKVREVIQRAALETPGILSNPVPEVRPCQYGNFTIDYEVRFWVADFFQLPKIEGEFLRLLWYRLDRAGIYVPFPTQHLYLHPYSERVQADQRSRAMSDILQALRGIDIFSPLSPSELERAALRIRVERYAAGEVVLREGDPGDSLFLIKAGEVEVSLGRGGEDHRTVARLGAGDLFGEMSLLTGEARSANVTTLTDCEFMVLDKGGFQDILTGNPTIAQALSEILARRRLGLDQERAKGLEKAKLVQEHSRSILSKIKSFFGLA